MTERSRLVEIVENFGKARVAVLGDFCLDVVKYVQAKKPSREAFAMVCDLEDEKHYPGAAANVAYNLVKLDADTVPFTVLGVDPKGDEIANYFKIKNTMIRSAERKTFVYEKIEGRAEGTSAPYQQALRIDSGTSEPLSESLENKLCNSLEKNLDSFDILIVSDYLKGIVTPRIKKAVNIMTGNKTLIGTARENILALKHFDILVLNDYETALSYNPKAGRANRVDEKALIECGKRLLDDTQSKNLIATRGAYGIIVIEKNNMTSVPTTEKKVVDITGAGDTTLAAIAASLSVGATLVEAAKIGNYAGGIVVQKPGTATASKEEILKEIQEDATLD